MTQDAEDTAETGFAVSYTLIGCAQHDLVLLRSVFSLYGKGRVVWRFQPSHEADLVVIGTELDPSAMLALVHASAHAGRLVLWIGGVDILPGTHQVFRCARPLRALQLVEQLHEIEILLRKKIPLPAAQQSETQSEPPEKIKLALVCWPSHAFLAQNRNFTRLAAMMSVRSMTLAELTARSGMPEEICRDFFQGLRQEGYAKKIKQTEDAKPPPVARHSSSPNTAVAHVGGLRGILQRIRIGLGFVFLPDKS
jgi:hypothetical protein